MRTFFKNFIIFCVGFTVYMCIEGVWKTVINPDGVQSYYMGLLAGTTTLVVGYLNKWFTWEMPLVLQLAIGTIANTLMEFIFGLILNVWLGLGIWDYSSLPGNIMGQVCWQFSIAWIFLTLLQILTDDYLRYLIYGEEKPHYHLLRWGKH